MKRFANFFQTNEDMGVETKDDLAIETPQEDAPVDLVEGAEASEPVTGVTVVEIDHSSGTVSVNGNAVSGAPTEGETIEEAVGEDNTVDPVETGAVTEDPQDELDEQSEASEAETQEVPETGEDPATEGEELDVEEETATDEVTEPSEDDKVSSEVILGGNEPSEEEDITDVDVQEEPDLDTDVDTDDTEPEDTPEEDNPAETEPASEEPEAEETPTEEPASEEPAQTPEEESEETPQEEAQETPEEQATEQEAGTEQSETESADEVLDADVSEDDEDVTEELGDEEVQTEESDTPTETEELASGEEDTSAEGTEAVQELSSEEEPSEDTPSTDEISGEEVPATTDETVEEVVEGESTIPEAQEPAVSSDDLSTSTAQVPEQTANTTEVDEGDQDQESAITSSETDMAEGDSQLGQASDGIQADGEAATLALDATDRLQELVSAAERAKETGGFNQEFAQVVEITHEAIVAPLGMSHRKTLNTRNPLVTIENYSHPTYKKDAVDVTIENIGKTIRALIERIIAAARAIWERIVNFGKQLMGQNKTIEQQIDALEKALESKKGFVPKEKELGASTYGARIGKEVSAKTATDICISAQRLMVASQSFMSDVAHMQVTGKSVSDLQSMRDKYIGRLGGGDTPGSYGNLGKGQSIEFAEDEEGKIYILDNGDEHGTVATAPTADQIKSVLKSARAALKELNDFDEVVKYAQDSIKHTTEILKKGLEGDDQAVEDITAPCRALLDYITFFSTLAPRVASGAVKEAVKFATAGVDNLKKP